MNIGSIRVTTVHWLLIVLMLGLVAAAVVFTALHTGGLPVVHHMAVISHNHLKH